MLNIGTVIASALLLLAGPGGPRKAPKKTPPHAKEFRQAIRQARESAERSEYQAATQRLEAFVKKWSPKFADSIQVKNATKGVERFRSLATHWDRAKKEPAKQLKAYLRLLLASPNKTIFKVSAAERATSFALANQHVPWMVEEVGQAFPFGIKVTGQADVGGVDVQQAFLWELDKISTAAEIPIQSDGEGWQLTMRLVVRPGGGPPVAGTRMKTATATGFCELKDHDGKLVTKLHAQASGIHINPDFASKKAAEKLAHDLLDRVVTYFITELYKRPD